MMYAASPGLPVLRYATRGCHPGLQTQGLLTESYYVLLVMEDAITEYRILSGLSCVSGGLSHAVVNITCPGVRCTRGYKHREPDGVLLCFVDCVCY